MGLFNKKKEFNPYRCSTIDEVGREITLSFKKLNEITQNPYYPNSILENNPLIKVFEPYLTYFNIYQGKTKQGLHYILDNEEIKHFAYFIDDKAVQVPTSVNLFLKVILNDFKGFCELVEEDTPNLNISTPDELLKGKNGYKYSLIEETLLQGEDSRFEFFEYLLNKNIDVSEYNIFNASSKKGRNQDIGRIALENNNTRASKLFMTKYPESITELHRIVIQEKLKEYDKHAESLKNISDLF